MERYIAKEIKDLDVLIGKSLISDKVPKGIINHTQFQILLYLIKHENEEVCQKDLEIETHLKKASITGSLDSLEEKGIVIRKQSEDDKRKNIILLSEKTKEAKDRIKEKFNIIEKKIEKDLTDKEIETFYRIIDKIKENLKEVD